MNTPATSTDVQRKARVDARDSPAHTSRASGWARLIATLAGIGYLKPGAGTWGSAATVVLWFAVASATPSSARLFVAIAWALAATLIGIPAATRVARADGAVDPSHVIVDEMAGQMIALIGVPLAWKLLLASFILFRCFDIVKPPPLRRLEQLRPEGVGIMLDDVGAGVYALIVMQLFVLRFGWAA